LSPTNIFAPASTPAKSIFGLSLFVLAVTGAIFLVVFGLLLYSVVKFRKRQNEDGREPPQVDGSNREDRILGGAAAARSSVGRGDFRVEAEDRVFRRLGLRVRIAFHGRRKALHTWNMQHNHLSPAAVKAGLGPIGWHTLRHTYRAWLGDKGEPLTVQKELMRHASIQTTLNTYGGGMMESMREAHGRVVKQAMAR
jgi:hypothetical protein